MRRGGASLRGGSKGEYRWALLSMGVPFALFFVVRFCPQLLNVFYSFTNYDGYSSRFDYVGLANYAKFFNYQRILTSFGNTFAFTACVTVLGAVTQLGMALVLHRGVRGAGFLRSFFYVPLLCSLVILSIVWNAILRNNGIVNTTLAAVGLEALARDWTMEVGTAMWSVILVNSWLGFGYGVILFTAGLNSIPPEIVESATIDGASGFRMFWSITLRLIMYSLTIDLFLGIQTLNTFELIFIMTRGGPRDTTLTVAMAIYEEAFKYERFGFAAACSLLFTVIVGALSFLQVRTTRRLEVQY